MIQHLKCKILVVIILLFNFNFQGQTPLPDGYNLRSIKIEPLTDKQKAALKKIPGGVGGFQIVAKGKNLKNNLSNNQIVRSIQSSKQYGDESAYGTGVDRLFVVDKVDLKKKENIKQIWVIYLRKLNDDDVDLINKLPKIGNSSYIIFKSFVDPEIERNITLKVYFGGRSVGNISKDSALEYSHIKAKELYCDGESAYLTVKGFSMHTTKNGSPITFRSKSDRLNPDMKEAIKKIPKGGMLVISNIKVIRPGTGVHIVPNSIVLRLM